MGGPPGHSSESLPKVPAGGGAERWLFCLRLLGGRYAFDAPLITEVVRLGPLTRIPAAPDFLRGVFTHRGEVLPVLDINLLVERKAIPIGPSTRAAIAHSGPWRVAVIVEGVEGLVRVGEQQLEPPPAQGSGIAEFLSAVIQGDRETIALIDLARLVQAAHARSVPT